MNNYITVIIKYQYIWSKNVQSRCANDGNGRYIIKIFEQSKISNSVSWGKNKDNKYFLISLRVGQDQRYERFSLIRKRRTKNQLRFHNIASTQIY